MRIDKIFIKNLEEKLDQTIQLIYINGYIRISEIKIDLDLYDNDIENENLNFDLKLAYGQEASPDLKIYPWQKIIEISVPINTSEEFISGMVYNYILLKDLE